jgi:hypothetical protein
MIRDRGYSGSVVQLRRTVARLRPQSREPFLQLQTFPGEHYGKPRVMVRGGATRAVSDGITSIFQAATSHNLSERRKH